MELLLCILLRLFSTDLAEFQATLASAAIGASMAAVTYSLISLEVAILRLSLAGCIGLCVMPVWCTARNQLVLEEGLELNERPVDLLGHHG